MRRLSGKIVSFFIILSLLTSVLPNVVFAQTTTYRADFTQLIKNNADTTYGTANDVYNIDDYTSLNLTYAGTYVSADGKVYLKSGTISNKNGYYSRGSYISFTAPYNGTLTVKGADIGWFEGETYKEYGGSLTINATKDTTYNFGYRKDTTYVGSITFEYEEAAEPTPTPIPTSTQTPQSGFSLPASWDFSTEVASEGTNVPILGGNAIWANSEVQFGADTTQTGTLSLNIENPVKNNVIIEFDAIGHSKALGQQWFGYSVSNTEDKIVDFEVHPYDANTQAKGLVIGGVTVADYQAIKDAWTIVGTTHIKTEIDYTALTVTVTIGTTAFSGKIPEGTLANLKSLEIYSRRSKTASDRYISVDNLSISEFTSTQTPALPTVNAGYTKETISGYTCQTKAQNGKNAVIYLCSENRYGTDGYSQLYDAQYIFDLLGDSVTLVAPQTESGFYDISTLVAQLKDKYNAPEVIVIGQSQSVKSALSSAADRIITIAGVSDVLPTNGQIWAFAGYSDTVTPITDVKTMVNTLQTNKIDTRYTEYPYLGHNIAQTVAKEEGLADWIINGANDSKVVDLILFAGQSNMAGRGDYENATILPAGYGYEYHSVTTPQTLSAVTEPFGRYENNTAINDNGGNGLDRRSGDMVTSLMKAYYEKTGVPMVGVQASRGGQATSYFMNATVMSEMQNRYKNAEKYLTDNGYTIRRKAVVWCQGEADADAGRSAQSYKTNLMSIFNSLKSGAGIEDLLIVKIGHYNPSKSAPAQGEAPDPENATDLQYKVISDAQQELADENDNIYAVASFYSDECYALMRDNYHYYQEAYNTVGAAAGENIAEIYHEEPKTYELISSDSEIDVSSLEAYGTTTYRLYTPDKNYVTVSSVDDKVVNSTGKTVTVVPVYKFNYTSSDADGYVTATGAYSYTKGYGLLSNADYKTNSNGSLPVAGSPLKVNLPDGYYDITVTRRGGARADVYSNGHQIINNSTSSGSQNRPSGSAVMDAPRMKVEGGNLNLTIGNTSSSNERVAYLEIAKVPDNLLKPTVWIAGDSESANYYPIDADGDDLESDKHMMTGFGMQLKYFLDTKYYNIANFGQPSATVNTWADECLDSVLYQMRKGDTLIMDFGINDAVSSSNKITVDQMKDRMTQISNSVKEKNSQPILVTPVYCGKYQSKSYFTYNGVVNSAVSFAESIDIPCIDLNRSALNYMNDAISQTGISNWQTYNMLVGDNLHQTQYFALFDAAIIAGGMKKLGYKTTDYAFTYSDISSFDETNSTMRGIVTGVTREYSIAVLNDYISLSGNVTVPDEGIVINKNTVTVNLNSADNAILIKASYENGILKAVKTYPLEFVNHSSTIEIPDINTGDKFFVWDSLETMQPLLNAVTALPLTPTPTPLQTQTPAPTPTPTPTPTPQVLYSQDFETCTVGTKAVGSSNNCYGWVSAAGTMEVKSDTQSNGIGTYMSVVSGKSGTCRSGYVEIPEISENFVFECDYKSSGNVNVNDLELLESKNSHYSNHGVYSNQNFVFTMARPKSSDCYVINNKSDDSGFTLTSYSDPVFKTTDISGNPWIHVKVVGDFDNQKVIVYLTSLDQKTEYHHGMYDMNVGRNNPINSWKCIHMLSPSSGLDTCIDNIVVRETTASDFEPVYHSVDIKLNQTSFKQYVLDKDSVINIPDVSMFGEYFMGWQINQSDTLLTSYELSNTPVTENSTITGIISDDYIENISSVSFNSFPASNQLVMGADENTYGDNEISLSIIGEQGTSLVTNPDKRVTDYKIDWIFDGFRILDGTPTGEIGNVYCDSYGLVEITETAQTRVNFKLKKCSANYYGKVTARVIYNGKTVEISNPLVVLGDKTTNSDIVLPEAGYTSDYNKYDTALSGYRLLTPNDSLFGSWASEGSDGSHYEFLNSENASFLRYIRNGSGNSAYGYYPIGNMASETVFEQDIRFGYNGSISYTGGSPTDISQTAWTAAFTGSAITFNGKVITAATKNTWYHMVVSMDSTSKKAWCDVYTKDGALLGSSGVVDFSDGNYTSGSYYRIMPSKATNAYIDLNNVRIYKAQINEDSFIINSPLTAQIPQSGTATVDISVSVKTTSDSQALGMAQWSIEDEFATGVSISSSGTKTAVLTIDADADSGELPIRCTINGKSKEFSIKLLGDKDNISFVKAPTGIEVGNHGEYEFVAEVRDGNAQTLSDRAVSYTLYDEANENTIKPAGVTLDSITGVMTLTKSAQPQTVGIRATATDSQGNEISKFIKVTLYSLDFSFTASNTQTGYTTVSANNAYSDNRGYGIDGNVSVDSNGISGSGATFKLRLTKGNVYEVSATYTGTISCEKISSKLSGFTRTQSSLGTDTYKVAIFGDDIMDITLGNNTTLKSVSVKKLDREVSQKPQWWTIGDSTVQQNGSWGYTIASVSTTDLSKYASLSTVCSAFYNSGKAGEKHTDYYANGRLNSILTQMKVGDVVSISGMGTNDSSSSQEDFKAFDRAYTDAIIDMGGYVILGTYTPTGNYGATKDKVYDSDTMTFKGKRTNAYDLAIRELYEEYKDNEKVLGFVDIGGFSDEMMSADVKAAYQKAISSGLSADDARLAANEKADEMMAWWKDYNHYYTTFSNYILPTLTDKVAELIGKIFN